MRLIAPLTIAIAPKVFIESIPIIMNTTEATTAIQPKMETNCPKLNKVLKRVLDDLELELVYLELTSTRCPVFASTKYISPSFVVILFSAIISSLL